MTKRTKGNAAKVVLVGLEPSLVDFANLPMKLDEPTLRAQLSKDENDLRSLGYDVHWLFVDRGETAEAVLAAALTEGKPDCVLIGAGIRVVPPLFSLFEKLVNVAHEKAPQAKIAFNTAPTDTAASVQRWV